MPSIALHFRDVTSKPFNADRSATILLNRMLDTQDYDEATVPIRRLIATQHSVNDDFATAHHRHAPDSPFRLPAVVRYQGSLYIIDGHHRIVADAMKGESYVIVRLFDLDGDENAPLLLALMG